LNIKEITRSSTQAQSIFKADISIKLDYSDEDEEGVDKAASQFYYDEWNLQTNRYKKSWCTVNQKTIPMPLDKTEFIKYHADIINKHRSEIVELRRLFNNALYDRRPKKRQIDGGDIDIDALINAHADIKSGHTPSNKLYISKTHTPADLAVCLLLDSSLSADSYVSGRKIVDIAKESIIVIQEVIDGLFENLMIATFFSNTRKNSSYNIIKGFDENWKVVQSRLENMVPTGYTRIGTSLRHSIHELGLTKVKNKVIILISDGKPTDYDAYEGKYGIADVRQCVREAKTQNIDILSLAIDKDAKFYFPQLFGVQNYQIISGANELPTQMIKLLSKVFKCKT
ncbi:MAG: VWA domain-containing protein, partial [Halobacteriovoraceae bacterium]|nr:VWA domain-containing protein [Halobacteriovoraceae bacterium]